MSLTTMAENWQYRLPDKTFVSVVSIPGSHDSATGSGWGSGMSLLGDRYAKTQELTIAEQWACGVRAFDLRPCVYDKYMNLNHGIMPTKLHFEDTMLQLRDSLRQNPTEFVIVHLLHEKDGDQVDDAYDTRIVEFLQSEPIRDCLIDFKRNLTVGEMRGKILILSRDKYATKPIGGFLLNWRTDNVNWTEQTGGKIQGAGSTLLGTLYMQDYSDTHNEGGLQTKLDAIKKMLDSSTKYRTLTASGTRWIFNFASAYSKVENLFGNVISLSDGYRDNATYTNSFIADYLQNCQAGPTGIIMMDYAGVDKTGNYATRGLELVQAIIAHNFRYLDDVPVGIKSTSDATRQSTGQTYDLTGRPIEKPTRGLYIKDGKKIVINHHIR
ncbi:MAG: hypothetical protein IJ064_07790 [Bacteroidaceae bacterium]|nr:hypothetical protein [Bacteroidaceae bacterium]